MRFGRRARFNGPSASKRKESAKFVALGRNLRMLNETKHSSDSVLFIEFFERVEIRLSPVPAMRHPGNLYHKREREREREREFVKYTCLFSLKLRSRDEARETKTERTVLLTASLFSGLDDVLPSRVNTVPADKSRRGTRVREEKLKARPRNVNTKRSSARFLFSRARARTSSSLGEARPRSFPRRRSRRSDPAHGRNEREREREREREKGAAKEQQGANERRECRLRTERTTVER